jgi:hypothetical protein
MTTSIAADAVPTPLSPHPPSLAPVPTADETSSERNAAAAIAAASSSSPASGAFYTSECRGGVQRRQMELKGVAVGD